MITSLIPLVKWVESLVRIIRERNLIPVGVQCHLGEGWKTANWNLLSEVSTELLECCQERSKEWAPEGPMRYNRSKEYEGGTFYVSDRVYSDRSSVPPEEYTLAGNCYSAILQDMGIKIITRKIFRWWEETYWGYDRKVTDLKTSGDIESVLYQLEIPVEKAVLLASCRIQELGHWKYKSRMEIKSPVALICPHKAAEPVKDIIHWAKHYYLKIKYFNPDC